MLRRVKEGNKKCRMGYDRLVVDGVKVTTVIRTQITVKILNLPGCVDCEHPGHQQRHRVCQCRR